MGIRMFQIHLDDSSVQESLEQLVYNEPGILPASAFNPFDRTACSPAFWEQKYVLLFHQCSEVWAEGLMGQALSWALGCFNSALTHLVILEISSSEMVLFKEEKPLDSFKWGPISQPESRKGIKR